MPARATGETFINPKDQGKITCPRKHQNNMSELGRYKYPQTCFKKNTNYLLLQLEITLADCITLLALPKAKPTFVFSSPLRCKKLTLEEHFCISKSFGESIGQMGQLARIQT